MEVGDILYTVFTFLDCKSIMLFSLVSKAWNIAAKNSFLWEQVIKRENRYYPVILNSVTLEDKFVSKSSAQVSSFLTYPESLQRYWRMRTFNFEGKIAVGRLCVAESCVNFSDGQKIVLSRDIAPVDERFTDKMIISSVLFLHKSFILRAEALGNAKKLRECEIVVFSFCPFSDSGVLVQKISTSGRRVYSQYIRSACVCHSEYEHSVDIVLVKGNIWKISSVGSYATITEDIDLMTGKSLDRFEDKRI